MLRKRAAFPKRRRKNFYIGLAILFCVTATHHFLFVPKVFEGVGNFFQKVPDRSPKAAQKLLYRSRRFVLRHGGASFAFCSKSF